MECVQRLDGTHTVAGRTLKEHIAVQHFVPALSILRYWSISMRTHSMRTHFVE